MLRLVTIILCFIIAACETTGGNSPAQLEDSVMSKPQIYEIGVGDGLNISVWRNADLSVAVPVRPDGLISVPLIGDIQAAGRQPEQLASDIKSELSNFIKNPQVTVVVTSATSSQFLNRIRVTGAVQAPTSVPYQKGMTVMDLVLVTGGPTEFANSNETKLYRNTANGPKVYTVRLKDILEKGDIKTNYTLQPGDIVTIPEKLF